MTTAMKRTTAAEREYARYHLLTPAMVVGRLQAAGAAGKDRRHAAGKPPACCREAAGAAGKDRRHAELADVIETGQRKERAA